MIELLKYEGTLTKLMFSYLIIENNSINNRNEITKLYNILKSH